MFDKFADDHRIVTDEIGEMSMELMSAPLRDTEKERLDNIKRELDQERQKFTEAAIKLGRERAEIEVIFSPGRFGKPRDLTILLGRTYQTFR